MSMDDQYLELRRFLDAMTHFNENLKGSMHELQNHHDRVDRDWQDAMRRTYDTYWEPLEQHMQNYIKREGPEYDRFLKSKLKSLGRYLNGS